MTKTKVYLSPRTLEEAVQCAAEAGATVLGGGTDLHPRWSKEVLPKPAVVVDVKAIEELGKICRVEGEISIGACALMSAVETDPLVRSGAAVLAEAAGCVACPQIRNRATLGGNLCNASPAADTAVPLILLDAVLELASLHRPPAGGGGSAGVAVRRVPITDFLRGPGATVLAPGEILTRVRFKPLPRGWFSAWKKFGTRPAMEIAVASVGVVLGQEGGVISQARVAYGSVAPIPLRGRRAEAELVGHRLSDAVIDRCTAAARDEVAPITDIRATEAYRREIVGVMLRRMLLDAQRS